MYVNDSGTLSLQKNLTLTGANAGVQLSGAGTIERHGFSVTAPAILTVNAPLTITDTAARALAVEFGGRLQVNADLTVGDVVVNSSATNAFGLFAGTFTADTMTVTSSSFDRSGGVYDIGSLTVEGSAWSFQTGDAIGSLTLSDATFPEAPSSFQADAALDLDALAILGTSVLTLGAFDGSDAFVADYGLRLVGDQATSLAALVTAGRIAAPGFGDLDVAYVEGADATYITVVPEPVVTGLAVIGLAAAAAARRTLRGRQAGSCRGLGAELAKRLLKR